MIGLKMPYKKINSNNMTTELLAIKKLVLFFIIVNPANNEYTKVNINKRSILQKNKKKYTVKRKKHCK